ncbi:MAG: hypothetical protein QOD12_1059 [Verrucomicrobiota bacterium]|jgi:hypothetical protein
MGSVRIYVVAAAGALLLLAAVGLIHLVTSGPAKMPSTSVTEIARPNDAVIAITEIGSSEIKGRNGQKNVAVRIGVTPRPHVRKGEVEIRVFFFDVTPNNEMRPTDAQVDYEWITPVRDWTDPTPKYLVATYQGAGSSRKAIDRLRYGGFVVRVYFDGQLQAEQSEPKELLAALRSEPQKNSTPSAASHSPGQIVVATATPIVEEPRAVEKEVTKNTSVTVPTPSSLVQKNDPSTPLPYASPVPDKPGFVYSPYDAKFLIDVRGFPPGTEVNDPNTGKHFRVP